MANWTPWALVGLTALAVWATQRDNSSPPAESEHISWDLIVQSAERLVSLEQTLYQETGELPAPPETQAAITVELRMLLDGLGHHPPLSPAQTLQIGSALLFIERISRRGPGQNLSSCAGLARWILHNLFHQHIELAPPSGRTLVLDADFPQWLDAPANTAVGTRVCIATPALFHQATVLRKATATWPMMVERVGGEIDEARRALRLARIEQKTAHQEAETAREGKREARRTTRAEAWEARAETERARAEARTARQEAETERQARRAAWQQHTAETEAAHAAAETEKQTRRTARQRAATETEEARAAARTRTAEIREARKSRTLERIQGPETGAPADPWVPETLAPPLSDPELPIEEAPGSEALPPLDPEISPLPEADYSAGLPVGYAGYQQWLKNQQRKPKGPDLSRGRTR